MMLERNGLRQGKYLIGFDLRDDFCQISYMENPGKRPPKEPVTWSRVPGQSAFDIPMAVAKKQEGSGNAVPAGAASDKKKTQGGGSRWLAGQAAVEAAADESCVFIPRLLSCSLDGRPVPVGEEKYDPSALLALFISRALSSMNDVVPTAQIAAIMFTTRDMSLRMIGVLENVRKRLGLSVPVYYEDYANSYYNFLLMQADSVREPASLLFEYDQDGQIYVMRMNFNLRLHPKVAFRDARVLPPLTGESAEERDQAFLKIAMDAVGREKYASCYLIGSGFDSRWMKRSLAFLCKGRRVFMGSNLYSKGAGYGAYFKTCNPEITSAYFFLDHNKLQDNIGIRGLEGGKNSLHSILDAGVNWYEARADCDIVLEDTNEVHLTLTPLSGGTAQDYPIRLEELPVREGRFTRIRMHFSMSAADKVDVLLEDMGFGEIFPTSGLKWRQQITCVR